MLNTDAFDTLKETWTRERVADSKCGVARGRASSSRAMAKKKKTSGATSAAVNKKKKAAEKVQRKTQKKGKSKRDTEDDDDQDLEAILAKVGCNHCAIAPTVAQRWPHTSAAARVGRGAQSDSGTRRRASQQTCERDFNGVSKWQSPLVHRGRVFQRRRQSLLCMLPQSWLDNRLSSTVQRCVQILP